MSDLDRAAVLDALDAVYQNVTAVAGGLGEADLMRPSRCAGWAVADVLYHELLDARRALRTFASPADRPPDRDDVSYWTGYAPAAPRTMRRSPPRTRVMSGSPRPRTRPARWPGSGRRPRRPPAGPAGRAHTRR